MNANNAALSADAQLALAVFQRTKAFGRKRCFYDEKTSLTQRAGTFVFGSVKEDGSFERAIDELLSASVLKKNKAGAISLADTHK